MVLNQKQNQNLGRKYFLDESFFDIIDTEEKAYFLGFFAADGTNESNENCAKIELAEKDKEILEKFKLLIKSEAPLGFCNWKKNFPDKQNSYTLRMCSRKISKKLSELGCTPLKSLNLKFPTEQQVSQKFIRHFIRRIF